MYRKSKSAVECLSLLLVVGLLGSAVCASAQGWGSGSAKPADNATKDAAQAARVAKTGKATKTPNRAKPKTGRCDPGHEERTDLSGTYSGNVKYPDGALDGDATLTISGNHFTLAAGSTIESGNISTVTTCNYTAVAMMFGQWKTPKPGEPVEPPLPVFSLRATRKGNYLTLIPSASERRMFSFKPAPKK